MSPPFYTAHSVATVQVTGNVSRADILALGSSWAYLNTSAPDARVKVRTQGLSTVVVVGGEGKFVLIGCFLLKKLKVCSRTELSELGSSKALSITHGLRLHIRPAPTPCSHTPPPHLPHTCCHTQAPTSLAPLTVCQGCCTPTAPAASIQTPPLASLNPSPTPAAWPAPGSCAPPQRRPSSVACACQARACAAVGGGWCEECGRFGAWGGADV